MSVHDFLSSDQSVKGLVRNLNLVTYVIRVMVVIVIISLTQITGIMIWIIVMGVTIMDFEDGLVRKFICQEVVFKR